MSRRRRRRPAPTGLVLVVPTGTRIEIRESSLVDRPLLVNYDHPIASPEHQPEPWQWCDDINNGPISPASQKLARDWYTSLVFTPKPARITDVTNT